MSKKTSKIENLCFEGGGVKGIAFAGALCKLDELGKLDDIKRIIGSSAGGIAAGALSVGIRPNEIKNILLKKDFKDFKDDTPGIFADAWRIIKHFGYYKGDSFYEWYGELLKLKTGESDITFQQVLDKYGKHLIITGTNVNKACTDYFSYETYPDMPIRKAIRISMSMPLIFKPIELDGQLYIDGGFLNTYPIGYFDLPNSINNKTLGLKLLNRDESQDKKLFKGELNTKNMYKYLLALIECNSIQIERGFIKPGYWERTVAIDCADIKSTDFNITDEQKEFLVNSASNAVEKFFK